MRFNATFKYRTNATNAAFVDGGYCYIETTSLEQLRYAEWGKDIMLGYKMYVRDGRKYDFVLGGAVDITMQDGQHFICAITGIDFTVRKIYTLSITSSTAEILSNGSVSFKSKTGGGIDQNTGYPISVTESWGTAVPCRMETVNQNLLAKDLSEHYTDAKYAIYIAGSSVPSEQLKLSDNNGSEIGEFSIISKEYNDIKDVTKILV